MRFCPFIVLLLLAVASGISAWARSVDDDLIYRINFGSAEDIRLLLQDGANPNAKSTQNETALDVAMERNDAEGARMAIALIEKGADIDAADKNGNVPLVIAIRTKEPSVVKTLLAKGADYHIQTTEGLPLIEYAKRYGDPESTAAIQALLDKESAFEASLRTPERFKEIIRQYALDSCTYQYWSYFLSSRQDPTRDDEVGKKIASIKKSLTYLVTQIQKYYTATSTEALQKISAAAVQQIYNIMDSMISNRNRAESGIGKEDDVKRRCEEIVVNLHMDFVPTLLNKNGTPVATPSSAVHSGTLILPMPVDPLPTQDQPLATPAAR